MTTTRIGEQVHSQAEDDCPDVNQWTRLMSCVVLSQQSFYCTTRASGDTISHIQINAFFIIPCLDKYNNQIIIVGLRPLCIGNWHLFLYFDFLSENSSADYFSFFFTFYSILFIFTQSTVENCSKQVIDLDLFLTRPTDEMLGANLNVTLEYYLMLFLEVQILFVHRHSHSATDGVKKSKLTFFFLLLAFFFF